MTLTLVSSPVYVSPSRSLSSMHLARRLFGAWFGLQTANGASAAKKDAPKPKVSGDPSGKEVSYFFAIFNLT